MKREVQGEEESSGTDGIRQCVSRVYSSWDCDHVACKTEHL